MRRLPHVVTGALEGQLLERLLRDIVLSLSGVKDDTIHQLEATWITPIDLKVPLSGNFPRLTSPDLVELGRAVDLANPTIPVHFGATAWNWVGDNTCRITDVAGLVAGTLYQLTFRVTG